MMSATTDDLRRRIAALLAKSASTDSPAEADSLAAKARELMERHQITMAELHRDADPLSGDTILRMPNRESSYKLVSHHGAIYLGACAVHGQEPDQRGRSRHYVRLYGRESARVTAALLIPYWWAECRRRGPVLHRERGIGDTPRAATNQLLAALGMRLAALASVRPAQAAQPGMLVPVDEARALAAQDGTTAGQVRSLTSRAAQHAAEEISLARQVSTPAPATHQISR